MTAANRQRAGFSLVELLIVVSLMAVLAGAIIPHMQPDVVSQLTNLAHILVVDLGYAQNLAITNDSCYQITFDTSSGRYTLKHSGSNPTFNVLPPAPLGRGDDPVDQQITRLSDLPRMGTGVHILTVLEQAGISGTPTAVADVEFTPLGATSRTAPTTIWLTAGAATGQRYLPIEINPVTGLATTGPLTAIAPDMPADTSSVDGAGTTRVNGGGTITLP